MKKTIFFIILFFLGFLFTKVNYVNAIDPCNADATYDANSSVLCGLPNFCRTCDAVNNVVNCATDSNGKIIGPIESCPLVRTDIHQANAPECASTCATPAPTCPTIICGTNSGAGGICELGNPNTGKNSSIPGCTATCPDGSQVPGYSVSVCQSNNCYYNDCTCYPILCQSTPAPTPAPTFAPAPICPIPPPVNNIRVTCPYCGT